MSLDWKKIWHNKGLINSKNKKLLNGYEKTTVVPKQVAKEISRALGISENTKVLEVGCGAGMLAEYMKCDYSGVDYSQTLVNKHKQLLNNKVFVAEANKLPFENNSFESVFCFSVFQYFPNIDYANQVIHEMLRVSKNNVFIGDIPLISHSSEHMLYKINHFKELGFEISNGYYNPDRFNAWR